MKFCNNISNNIKNNCNTTISGIKRIYLINGKDFIGADETSIYLTVGSSAFEIDAAKNTASLVQTAITNSIEQTHIQSVLTFSINKNATNLIPQQMDLTLGRFKLLIEYWDRTWLFVDAEPEYYFKMTNAVRNTGVQEKDFGGLTYTYTLRSLSYGIDYNSMPDIITDESTDPVWTLISNECEVI